MFWGRGANCGCRGECGIICGEGRGEDMPYTVQKHDDSLELAAKFFATPEGEDFLKREWEKYVQQRAREASATAEVR